MGSLTVKDRFDQSWSKWKFCWLQRNAVFGFLEVTTSRCSDCTYQYQDLLKSTRNASSGDQFKNKNKINKKILANYKLINLQNHKSLKNLSLINIFYIIYWTSV